jgi:hypothetical protein
LRIIGRLWQVQGKNSNRFSTPKFFVFFSHVFQTKEIYSKNVREPKVSTKPKTAEPLQRIGENTEKGPKAVSKNNG